MWESLRAGCTAEFENEIELLVVGRCAGNSLFDWLQHLQCSDFRRGTSLEDVITALNDNSRMPLPISVFIIACNEVERIGRTIASVRDLTDDIVVIDSGSTDGTQALARSLGARVIEHPWPGYGEQKRFGEMQCRYDWRFNLDADEVVTPRLFAEICQLFAALPAPSAYSVRIVEVMPNRLKPTVLSYSHRYIRLYHRLAGSFSTSPVHDLVEIDPKMTVKALRNIIHHFSLKSVGSQLTKFNGYTDALVRDLEQRQILLPTWRLFVELPLAFLKAYIGRRHFTRGTYGYITAMNYAFFRHLRVAKHYEQHHQLVAENSPRNTAE